MAEGDSTIPDLETQKKEIDNLIKSPLKKGETWYLIDTKWYKQWKKYVGFDAWDTYNCGEQTANPGPIDNTPLFKDGANSLKEHLIDELDYVLVPVEGWNKLVAWYGLTDGQDPIARKVIEQGMFVKHCKVEVYLMDLKLCQNSSMETVLTEQFSRADTIDQLEKQMRKLFEIAEEKEVRLWNRYMSNTYEHLNKPESTLQDAGLYHGQVIVIEEKNEDGSWPRQAKSTNSYNSASSSPPSTERTSYSATRSSGYGGYSTYDSSYGSNYSYYNSYEGRGSANPGLCGLANLGNTCFMNSALQCMSNVPLLTKYMLADKWEDELNEENPLGMHGEIARSYAELIKIMWSGKYSCTVPRNFKMAVSKFAPQFSGYQQHDSQELMAFLLDGLHEDLNRIRKKPYVELRDAGERDDKEVAQEAWHNYKLRNDSIIVDTFHGLLKSTVQCPDCEKISVTFDPFCYLSLPLPIKKERQIEIFWVALAPESKPVQFKLTVPKSGSIFELCTALASYVNVTADKMVVTDVYNHRFHKVFSSDEALSHILERDDIFIYEVPTNSPDDPDTLILPIYLREKKLKPGQNVYQLTTSELFGQPLLLPVPRQNCTYEELYNLLLKRMSRYVIIPNENDKWWLSQKLEEKERVQGKHAEETVVNGDVAGMDTENDENSCDDTQPYTLEPSSVTDSNGFDEIDNDDDKEAENDKHRLFKFVLVNSYGSTEMNYKLCDNGLALKLTGKSYVAVEWDSAVKDKFYDEKSAEDFEQHSTVRFKQQQKKQVIQLDECLQLFTTTEKLGENDPWYCPQCKKHQQATKKFDLWDLPNVLIIHLKRFSYNRYWRDKIDALVEFPHQNLDLRKYVINDKKESLVYDLIAVCNHYGGMGGGHYTAFGKNKDDGEIYYFDDSGVSSSSEDSVCTKAAYVLVYQKQGLEPKPEYTMKSADTTACTSLSSATASVSSASASASTSSPDELSSNGLPNSEDDMEVN